MTQSSVLLSSSDRFSPTLKPVSTTATQFIQGHMYFPVWEELLIVDEAFSVVTQDEKIVILFEVLNISTKHLLKNSTNEDASTTMIAWAFLKPLGANGHRNTGPRKQRLQLFEPVPTDRPPFNRSSSTRGSCRQKATTGEGNPELVGQSSGENLFAWWAAGTSARIRYPSTLYVTVKRIGISPEQLQSAEFSDFDFQARRPSLDLITMNTDGTDALSASSLLRSRSRTRLSGDTQFDQQSRKALRHQWRRKMEEACRLPNTLVGLTGGHGSSNQGAGAGDGHRHCESHCEHRHHHHHHENGSACAVRFSPDGNWIAVGTLGMRQDTNASQESDCAVLVYQHPLDTHATQPFSKLTGHTRLVHDVAWSPQPIQRDSDTTKCPTVAWLLASASADGTVRVWWLPIDKLSHTHSYPSTHPLQETDMSGMSLNETNPSKITSLSILESHANCGVSAETTAEGVLCSVLGHPGFVYSVAFRPIEPARMEDGATHVPVTSHILATACYDGVIRLWHIACSRTELRSELSGRHKAHVNTVAFSIDGHRLYSGDASGVLNVWRSTTDSSKTSKKAWRFDKRISLDELEDCVINHVAVHPNQQLLLVHTRDGCLKMIDLRCEFITSRFHGAWNHRELLRSCISPCGTFVISGSEDRTVCVWNAMTGDQVACYRQLPSNDVVKSVDFHPTEHVIAFASMDVRNPLLVYGHDPGAESFGLSIFEKHLGFVGDRTVKHTIERTELDRLRTEKEKHKTERVRRVLRKLDSVTGFPLNTPHLHVLILLKKTTPQGFTEVRPSFVPCLGKNTISSRSNTEDDFHSNPLEWRPKFTAIDKVPGNTDSVRGQPDGRGQSQLDKSQHTSNRASKATVLYDYQAQRSDELSLERGARVRLLYRDSPKWWMAKSLTSGKEGFVADNYLSFDKVEETPQNVIKMDKQMELHAPPPPPKSSAKTNSAKARSAADRLAHLIREHECKLGDPTELKMYQSDGEQLPVPCLGSTDIAKGKAEDRVRVPRRRSRPLPEGSETSVHVTEMKRGDEAKSDNYMGRRASRPLPELH